jgi:hypothetical protein
MSYIGSTPVTQSFIAGTDYFNGTGSATAFTLSRSVVSVNDIQATVNNVVQVPNDAYTVSGTTITFTSAPSAGTGNIYVRYLSTTTQSITPSQGTVSWSTLNADVQQDLGISFKNRIINGAMVINQRAFSGSAGDASYTLDRWLTYSVNSSKYTVSQNAGSVTPPAGFTNYLGVTSSAATTVGSTDYYGIAQKIEGFNTADLNWGSANAKTVTLSFWVYSSLTGSFGAAILNSANNYSYPFSYTISAANTWTKISVTVPGPTAGTWIGATNGTGIQVNFSLGYGSTFSGTANAWVASQIYSVTGSTNVVSTNGATWYLTGVMLEVGTQATTFDYRSYGTELSLCQRYLPAWAYSGSNNQTVTGGFMQSSTGLVSVHPFPVTTRIPPTGITVTSGSGSMNTSYSFNGAGTNPTVATFYYSSTSSATISWTITGATQYAGTQLYCTASGSSILFTGCEL